MFKLLRILFGGTQKKRALVDGWWCDTPVKLPSKVKTPLGGNASVIKVCVDITYQIIETKIVLLKVRLSDEGSLLGRQKTNVAAERSGEAWYAAYLCPEKLLRASVEKDLQSKNSELQRLMFGKWKAVSRADDISSLVRALNRQASPKEIELLLTSLGSGHRLRFTYHKENSPPEVRQVTIHSVSGKSIRVTDHKDGESKLFRIDRIRNVSQL